MRRSRPQSVLSTNLSSQSWHGEFELYEEEGTEESSLNIENEQTSQLCENSLSFSKNNPKMNQITLLQRHSDSESLVVAEERDPADELHESIRPEMDTLDIEIQELAMLVEENTQLLKAQKNSKNSGHTASQTISEGKEELNEASSAKENQSMISNIPHNDSELTTGNYLDFSLNNQEKVPVMEKENFQIINAYYPKESNNGSKSIEKSQIKALEDESFEDESLLLKNHQNFESLPAKTPPNSSNRSFLKNASKCPKVTLTHNQSNGTIELEHMKSSQRSDRLNEAIFEEAFDSSLEPGFSKSENGENLIQIDEAELDILMALKRDVEKIKYSHQKLKLREDRYKEYIQKLKAENMDLVGQNKLLRALYQQVSEKCASKESEFRARADHELSGVVKILDDLYSKKIECILSVMTNDSSWWENAQILKKIDKFADKLADESSLFLSLTRNLCSLNQIFEALSKKAVSKATSCCFPSSLRCLSEGQYNFLDSSPLSKLKMGSVLDKDYADFEINFSIDSKYHNKRVASKVRSKTPKFEKGSNQRTAEDLVRIIKDQKYEIELLRKKEHSCYATIENLNKKIQPIHTPKHLYQPGRPLQSEFDYESTTSGSRRGIGDITPELISLLNSNQTMQNC